MGSSTEMALWVTPLNPLLIACNYLQKKFWVSFKFILKTLACVDNHSPSSSRSASRTWIWWQSGACSVSLRMPWTYAIEIPNLLAVSQMAILLQFWAWIPLLDLCFHLFCFLMYISIIWYLHGGHVSFDCKTTHNLCSSLYMLWKATLNILDLSVVSFMGWVAQSV
jgi:hypothetical protein